ncbi:MAG TPA: TRCF domain-containing protein, partial [Ktedonobacterales bacterium]|nr:TRCF domain-containing protein [Ktedonobacterales bacterium]
EQSGFANMVGFDLYTKLLADAVMEMRGERAKVRPREAPTSIELPVDAYIPDDFINDRTLKMNFYQRLANLDSPEQVEAMVAEMTDRFGALPEPVANLLALVQLKTEAAALGFESLAARDAEVIFKLRRAVAVDRVALYKRFRNEARVQLGEVRVARRHFAAATGQWLTELRELLPLIVGRASSATPGSRETSSSAVSASRTPVRP